MLPGAEGIGASWRKLEACGVPLTRSFVQAWRKSPLNRACADGMTEKLSCLGTGYVMGHEQPSLRVRRRDFDAVNAGRSSAQGHAGVACDEPNF